VCCHSNVAALQNCWHLSPVSGLDNKDELQIHVVQFNLQLLVQSPFSFSPYFIYVISGFSTNFSFFPFIHSHGEHGGTCVLSAAGLTDGFPGVLLSFWAMRRLLSLCALISWLARSLKWELVYTSVLALYGSFGSHHCLVPTESLPCPPSCPRPRKSHGGPAIMLQLLSASPSRRSEPSGSCSQNKESRKVQETRIPILLYLSTFTGLLILWTRNGPWLFLLHLASSMEESQTIGKVLAEIRVCDKKEWNFVIHR
jgi:hypothetical protein